MRFPLSSDTDRPLSHSAVGTPLPGWRHARPFSDRTLGLPAQCSVRGSASCPVSFPQRLRRWYLPTSLPRPSPPRSAVPFPRAPRRAPVATPPFRRELAASRSASQQPPFATRAPVRATREPSHSTRHSTIPKKAALPDSGRPARRRMRSTPSHPSASSIAKIRTSASYSCRLPPLFTLRV